MFWQHGELEKVQAWLSNEVQFLCMIFFNFLKDFIYFIFRERGREGKREREKHQCVVVSHMPPTGDLAHNPGTCPDQELNRRAFGLQAGAQPTEPR